jgi:hypothetical protein
MTATTLKMADAVFLVVFAIVTSVGVAANTPSHHDLSLFARLMIGGGVTLFLLLMAGLISLIYSRFARGWRIGFLLSYIGLLASEHYWL